MITEPKNNKRKQQHDAPTPTSLGTSGSGLGGDPGQASQTVASSKKQKAKGKAAQTSLDRFFTPKPTTVVPLGPPPPTVAWGPTTTVTPTTATPTTGDPTTAPPLVPQSTRASRPMVPLGRPSRPGYADPVPKPIQQPRMTLTTGPLRVLSGAGPGELATLRTSAPPLPVPTQQPRTSPVSSGLAQHEKVMKPFDSTAKSLGLTPSGANQGGLAFDKSSMLLPKTMDFSKAREAQLMSEMSAMALHRLSQTITSTKDKTPEVQMGLGEIPGGGFDLYASSNTPVSQTELAKALGDPRSLIDGGLTSKDPDLERMALKLLYFKEQQEDRRARDGADPEALDMTDAMYKKMMDGDVTVATSKYPRHAEQVAGEKMHETNKYSVAQLAGTKIRCGSCVSELGADLLRPDGSEVSGRVYPSQAKPERLASSMKEIASGRRRVATDRSDRSRSSSPPAALTRLRREKAEQAQKKEAESTKPTTGGGDTTT